MKILVIVLTLLFVQSSYAHRFIVSQKGKNITCIAMCNNGQNHEFIISLPQFGGSTQDICNIQGERVCGRLASPHQEITPPKN